MTRSNRLRTFGFVLLSWGILGALGVAGIVVLFTAPWFEGDSWQLPRLFSPIGIFALVGFASAALSFVAGRGLLRSTPSARPLALTASVLSLATVPIGTVVGIYGLLVLRRSERDR